MEDPSCPTTPPDTILALLWTIVAVFGIVYAVLGKHFCCNRHRNPTLIHPTNLRNPIPGYRCLRAVGFLSGLAAGLGCIYWLQSQEVTLIGSQADSGKNRHADFN